MLTGCTSTRPQEAVITLDPSQRYQTIVGWEATAQAGQDFASYPSYRDKLISDAVNELGITRIRLELRSGLENPTDSFRLLSSGSMTESQFKTVRYEILNDNDDPFLINEAGFQFSHLDQVIDQIIVPMQRLLKERGEKLDVNLNYVDFGSSAFEHKNNPEEYAEFILAAFLHLKAKYGFVPDTVELVLEPDTDNADWSAKQVAQAAVATAKRLKANGFEPAFIAPSTTNAAKALDYIDEIATTNGAMDGIVEFSYHRYWGVSEKVLTEIGERGRRYGKRTSMLEWIGADQNTLHEDLKLANVSAWQQYTLAYSGSDDGGAYYKVESEDSDSKITMGSRTQYLRQYFNCVERGAVRVAASTSNADLDPVAFQNSTGNFSVVIKADSAGTVTIRGLSPHVYSLSYATEDEPDVRFMDSGLDANGELTVTIPDAGVLSICAPNKTSSSLTKY